MRTIKNYLKIIASLLALLMLLESCTVYKNASITLDQAVNNEAKVKVKTETAENLKFNRIDFNNGNYYGIKKTQGEIVKIQLDEKKIISIREKDEAASTVATILLTVGSVAIILVGAYLISGVGPALDFSME